VAVGEKAMADNQIVAVVHEISVVDGERSAVVREKAVAVRKIPANDDEMGMTIREIPLADCQTFHAISRNGGAGGHPWDFPTVNKDPPLRGWRC